MYPIPTDKDRVDRLMAVMAASGVYDELMDYFDSIAKHEQVLAEKTAVNALLHVETTPLAQRQLGRAAAFQDLVQFMRKFKQ
ncbi:MAG: hypothetical protein [Bacteriophage sp.]|nr:MAG: hypothetical protein [Bacteriophage sp.]